MLLSRRPLQLDVGCDLLLNGVKLKRLTEVRFLGVVLRDNLSFASHIKCVANKVSKYVSIPYKVRNNLTVSSLKSIFHSIVYLNIIYCISVLGNSPHSQLYSLEVALKKTVRVMSFSGYYDHTSPLFNNLGLLKLNNIRIQGVTEIQVQN